MKVDPRADPEFMAYRRLAAAVLLQALSDACAPVPILPPRPARKEMLRRWQDLRREAHDVALLRRDGEQFLLGFGDVATLDLCWHTLGLATPSRHRVMAIIDYQRQHQVTLIDTPEDLCLIAC